MPVLRDTLREKNIPSIDPDLTNASSSRNARLEQIELDGLEAENALKESTRLYREQRRSQRAFAFGLGVAVVILMALSYVVLLWHVICGDLTKVDPKVLTVFIVSPIASVTAVTVALVVGAFRRYNEGDAKFLENTATSATSILRG